MINHWKKFLLSNFVCFLLFTSANATSFTIDTLSIYQKVAKIPSSNKKSTNALGNYFAGEFSDEPSRAFAISYWICNAIDYDFKGQIERRIEAYTPEMVLKTKEALCGEYAALFTAICDEANLQSVVVDGYTRPFDFLPNDTLFRAEHSWSAVKVNGQWQLIDLTYAAGRIITPDATNQSNDSLINNLPYHSKANFEKKFNPQWIFTAPDFLIFSHYPILPEFQLLKIPLPLDSFRLGKTAVENHLRKHRKIENVNIAQDVYYQKNASEKQFYLGDTGKTNNPFDNRTKGLAYLTGIENNVKEQLNTEKNILSGSKTELKALKGKVTTADAALKLSLQDNELEYRQIQKRSENWKMNLKTFNKLHKDDLKERIRANNSNLKNIDKLYQKGISLTQHLNERKAQYITKDLEAVQRPKLADPAMEKEAESLIRQQDSIRKLTLGVLFKIENVIRAYNQEKVIALCNNEKQALALYESSSKTLEDNTKANKRNLFLVHIPTTNIDKDWLKLRNKEADKINKENIDTLLINLSNNQLELYNLIREYTNFLKERLNLLKIAKKSSTVDSKEDALYQEAINNFSDNLLSYHYELKTYTITKELLKDNLENENKRMTQLMEALQKESDLENDRHKNYLVFRKEMKDAENLKTKTAIKRLIKINTLIDKSLILAK